MELFDRLDKVNYNGYQLTNILRRAKPIKSILDRVDVYFDYVIKEGERADTIAYDYYGDSSYTWLVYIANNIYDPYYQWPLSHSQLYDYITRKYGNFYQTQVDIKWYKHPEKSFGISPQTFLLWTPEQQFGWYPQTYYQFEEEMNEKKRQIKLVSNRYLDQINQQVSAMFE